MASSRRDQLTIWNETLKDVSEVSSDEKFFSVRNFRFKQKK